jgi:hypothetical protein
MLLGNVKTTDIYERMAVYWDVTKSNGKQNESLRKGGRKRARV